MTSQGWRGGFPLFALLLIALGILLLLQTTGVLPWELWRSIWRLWPLLLIAIGINIIFGRRMPWLAGVLIGIVMLIGVGIGIFFIAYVDNSFRNDLVTTALYEYPLGEVKSADVRIDFGAGELGLHSLPDGSTNLVEANFRNRNADISIDRSGDSAKLRISNPDSVFEFFDWQDDGATWSVSLSPRPRLSIDLDTGASDTYLDLRRLRVSDLSIDAGATDMEVIMPAGAGNVNADIDVGAASIVIVIPEGVGAWIDADTAVGSLSIDHGRFPKQGDIYISPDFDVLANRIYLTINSGASSVEIR